MHYILNICNTGEEFLVSSLSDSRATLLQTQDSEEPISLMKLCAALAIPTSSQLQQHGQL